MCSGCSEVPSGSLLCGPLTAKGLVSDSTDLHGAKYSTVWSHPGHDRLQSGK